MGKTLTAVEIIDTVFRADAGALQTAHAMKRMTPNTVDYARAKSTLEVWCEILATYTDESYDDILARYEAASR
jgi:hypothetical protein